MNLIAELKRRKVIRVAVLYIGATWALSQGISQLTPALDLPDWSTRAFLIVAAIAFVIVIGMLWFFDVTPHGVRLDAGAPSPASGTVPAVPSAVALNAQTAPEIPCKSVAVLPFSDLSPTHDQEYFSDGVAEEILNALVKLKDLKVAGRTSSFSFKGRNQDLRVVGRTLAVAYVLEGSVRKHGDRMRITAQLIRTDDGYHSWSDNFDGDVVEVFELQERIARAVAREFDVILHGDQRLVPVATRDPEAYRLYLQASDIFNKRDVAHMAQAVELLQKAITLDPEFARAHARLASVYALQTNYSSVTADTCISGAMAAAAQASALDPHLGEPYSAMALVLMAAHRFTESRETIEKALQRQPDDAGVWYWAGTLGINTGYVDWARANLDRALVLDPLYPAALLWRGVTCAIAGDVEDAERLYVQADAAGAVHAGLGMHTIVAGRGDAAGAARWLARGLVILAEGLTGEQLTILAEGAYGSTAARARALELIDEVVAAQPRWLPGAIPYALLVMGETSRALELGMRFRSNSDIIFYPRFWMPSFRPVRQSREFRAFVHHVGLTALWDRYGPPDGSRRDAAGEYVWD